MSNWQFNKLKPVINNGTKETLNLSLKVIGNSNDETNFHINIVNWYTNFKDM